MMDRLDDLKSIQDDFSEIMTPLVRISEDLSRSSVRNVELEALLGQERQSGSALRQEAADLVVRLASAGNDLSGLGARAEQAEAALEERDAAIEELRITQRDRALMIENLERQLFAETEQTKRSSARTRRCASRRRPSIRRWRGRSTTCSACASGSPFSSMTTAASRR